jgi:hypothetical protein
VVQFRKKGPGMLGIWCRKGAFSGDGRHSGRHEMFRLTPIQGGDANAYEGIYISYQGDGSRASRR